jgi:hypothetical protein
MDPLALAVVALAVLGFGLISGRMERSIVTPPMVFVIFGLLMSDRVLGLVPLHVGSHVIHVLAEVTLVLVLFTEPLGSTWVSCVGSTRSRCACSSLGCP